MEDIFFSQKEIMFVGSQELLLKKDPTNTLWESWLNNKS